LSSHPFIIERHPVVLGATVDLPPLERSIAQGFNSSTRTAEFVAGRLAARAALTRLLGGLPPDLAIGRDGDGAPLLGLPGVVISISHGRTWAVAACGYAQRLGIDLCDDADSPRVERVAGRWIAAEDRAIVAQLSLASRPHATADGGNRASPGTPRAWATLWALKEAGAKALRLGLLEGGLAATSLSSLDPPRFTRPDDLQAALVPGAHDVVALAWTP
jgi:phosphopantetheinyl transferase